MKIQDILFLLCFIVLLWKRDTLWATVAGLVLLAASIPLFAFWIFFTAEHFIWYATACFLLAGILFVQKA